MFYRVSNEVSFFLLQLVFLMSVS